MNGKRYQVMVTKETENTKLIMTKYRTLDELEGATAWMLKNIVDEIVGKWFNYCEMFGKNLWYCHKI